MKQSTEEHFASHWLTIQPSLFDFLEDEVGGTGRQPAAFRPHSGVRGTWPHRAEARMVRQRKEAVEPACDVQDVRDEACLEHPDDQGRASPCAPRRTPSAAAPILRTPFGPSPSPIPGRGRAGLSANGSQNVVLCWFRLRQPCFRPLPSMFHLSSVLRPCS